jgi:hypothetical protein
LASSINSLQAENKTSFKGSFTPIF